jgi:hypothetical protein
MKKLIYLVLLLSIFFYCGPKQKKVEKVIEDGVEVVLNHIEPYKIKGEPSILHLEREFSIDTEKEGILQTGLTDIWDFDVDSEGSVFLISYRSREYVLFKFDKSGNFVTSFGRKGQGPGELQRPVALKVNKQDEIMVTDRAKKRLFTFDKDGSFVRKTAFDSDIKAIYPLDNGLYLIEKILIVEDESGEWFTQLPLILCSPEFEEIKELGRQILPDYKSAKRIKGIWPVFTWSVSGRKIFVGNDEKGYEILVYDIEGKLVRKIRKDYKPVDIPKELKEKVLNLFKPYRDKIYFPSHWPPFQYLFTDDEGRLFIMTFEEGKNTKEYIYDVFNSEGIFVARINLSNYGFLEYIGKDSPLEAKAYKNRLYCLQEKESGYKELVVYKMRWE